jgi:hypothetical protein
VRPAVRPTRAANLKTSFNQLAALDLFQLVPVDPVGIILLKLIQLTIVAFLFLFAFALHRMLCTFAAQLGFRSILIDGTFGVTPSGSRVASLSLQTFRCVRYKVCLLIGI